MLTYVVGDIHGCYDLLMAALDHIQSDAETGTVIFLGDYVDRGPDSKKVVEHLMAGPPEGWKWICLQGNHEVMLLGCHDLNPLSSDFRWWLRNGGGDTMQSYEHHIPKDHVKWFENDLLPLFEDEHRVYVHAMVEEHLDLVDQPKQIRVWKRYPERADVGYRGKHVVHGHTPIGPEMYKHRTNLDACGFGTGRIAIGKFDDDVAGGPIHTILKTSANMY